MEVDFWPQPVRPSYLAVLGRIAPEKGVDRAIKIAIRANMPLKIAANIELADQHYDDHAIRPLRPHPLDESTPAIGGTTQPAAPRGRLVVWPPPGLPRSGGRSLPFAIANPPIAV